MQAGRYFLIVVDGLEFVCGDEDFGVAFCFRVADQIRGVGDGTRGGVGEDGDEEEEGEEAAGVAHFGG